MSSLARLVLILTFTYSHWLLYAVTTEYSGSNVLYHFDKLSPLA